MSCRLENLQTVNREILSQNWQLRRRARRLQIMQRTLEEKLVRQHR